MVKQFNLVHKVFDAISSTQTPKIYKYFLQKTKKSFSFDFFTYHFSTKIFVQLANVTVILDFAKYIIKRPIHLSDHEWR